MVLHLFTECPEHLQTRVSVQSLSCDSWSGPSHYHWMLHLGAWSGATSHSLLLLFPQLYSVERSYFTEHKIPPKVSSFPHYKPQNRKTRCRACIVSLDPFSHTPISQFGPIRLHQGTAAADPWHGYGYAIWQELCALCHDISDHY